MQHPFDTGTIQLAFSAALVDEWARCGATHAVVAPGSRSTPVVVALASERRLGLHVVLDERSAGFVALGIGLATGRPAPVVTTSGTAAVELHPAVVEASQAHVPMLAVTADRPPELHQVGAPQTVEQRGLFGAATRWEADPGVPEEATAGAWRSIASRAFATACAGPRGPGPVHLNLAFREPLLPRGAAVPISAALQPTVAGRPGGEPWHRWSGGPAEPPAELVEHLASLAGRRGLLVVGAGCGEASALFEAAERLGWPVLADPRSGARVPREGVVAAADALLRVPSLAEWAPEVVVRAGQRWASRVLEEWLTGLGDKALQVLVDPYGSWGDPGRVATAVVAADPTALWRALASALDARAGSPGSPGSRPAWFERWVAAEAAAQAAIEEAISAEEGLSEPGVARLLLACLAEGTCLVASSSMPVRDLEWYGAAREGVRVMSNRGANGIDGVVSTALGVAIGSGSPTVGLLGDLAFLHDAGGLLSARWNPGVALSLLVVDNDGGGIFSFLPQARTLDPAVFERLFATPHRADLTEVARSYGAAASRIETADALRDWVAGAAAPGVRVAVVRSAREDNVAAHARIHATVEAAVTKAVGPTGRCS